MNYQESLDFIENTHKFGRKLGLENITILLHELGDPHIGMKYVHVAGSNGKGSTCAMIATVLQCAGYKTGLYISPYLERFNERIQINRNPIPDDDLAENTTLIKEAIDRMVAKGYDCPSEFEVITAIAYNYYRREGVDIIVFEVGMGGRMDATNTCPDPEAEVICSLSLEHQQYLGDTIEKIAGEKAGIIKENSDVSVYGLVPPETVPVIKAKADSMNARMHLCDPNDIELISHDISGQIVKYKRKDSILGIDEFKLALIGNYQVYNCLNVLNTLEILKGKGWNITPEAIKEGLNKVAFTGRFEVLHKDPVILIDGGHNIEGITVFTNSIKTYFPGKKVVLFYGMLNDKAVDDSIRLLCSIAKKVYTLTPDDPSRAIQSAEMAKMVHNVDPSLPVQSLDSFQDIMGEIDVNAKDEIYAFTGSLYMIGEARTVVNNYFGQN
ncbi:MAG: bifunctional folylpolyglutamate synthase/dihydrofolate synthase [Eubacteriaceae bacterium]|nr:bifunctional folylpolyglutamate synthase/dihydrofolate synthase [Eubacteriaceae bacterium]